MTHTVEAITTTTRRVRIVIRGRVQGVGFRPAIYRAVTARDCAGSIRNTPEGVVLELEGRSETVREIVENFRSFAPPRARIDEMDVQEARPLGQAGFSIVRSSSDGQSLLPIPPDLATCPECLRELRGCGERRRTYAFNTCTACGPRFTIARAVPFDRPASVMEHFPLCPRCTQEYGEPSDRRFHAQTMSCPECGPTMSFFSVTPAAAATPKLEQGDALELARRMIKDGKIIALKGVGGFHLACDAAREEVVQELRRRKSRPAKPFALMARDIQTCRRICEVSPIEEQLLCSEQAPIVLLRKKPDAPVAPGISPGLKELGVMLPYTPLHHLLFDDPDMPPVLVMTSCNRSEEPIAAAAEAVFDDLRDMVDGVLTHNRTIANRCDDSVVAVFADKPLPVRRSRGHVPEPILLERGGPPTFATGAMDKNTFALTSGRRVFVSPHMGDISDADSAAYFVESFHKFSELLRLRPEIVACDLHPDYPTTRFAHELSREAGLELVQVQHHHAHIASCLAENGRSGPVIGVSMDGSGCGDDGAVWGGEFLVADLKGFERKYHLEYVPMPGGEQAILQPVRMALSHLASAIGPDAAVERLSGALGEGACRALLAIMANREFSPFTSSCGRLFDAVAAIIGIRQKVTYDAQAACELEAVCDETEHGAYEFDYNGESIMIGPIVGGVCSDLDRRVPKPAIAARFHNTVAGVIVETCRRLRSETGVGVVALSGGVMQNRFLLSRTVPVLEREGFEVLLHSLVPPNDGGISLGQAACAIARAAR